MSFTEAVAVFSDPMAQTIFDPDHGAATDEERWVSMGQAMDVNWWWSSIPGLKLIPTTSMCG